MADRTSFPRDKKTPEENDAELVQFIEGSLKMLEQARAAVQNTRMDDAIQTEESNASKISNWQPPSSPTNTSTSSRADAAANEFKTCFPGLSSSISGKNVQTYFKRPHSAPFSAGGKRGRVVGLTTDTSPQSSGSGWSCKKILHTWTHDFVCLARNQLQTPTITDLQSLKNAGLGKKKIVFKNKRGDNAHIQLTLEGYFLR